MFILLMMAIIISIYHRKSGTLTPIAPRTMILLTIPALALILSAGGVGYARLNAEVHTKRALAARKASVWPAVIYEIDKAYI